MRAWRAEPGTRESCIGLPRLPGTLTPAFPHSSSLPGSTKPSCEPCGPPVFLFLLLQGATGCFCLPWDPKVKTTFSFAPSILDARTLRLGPGEHLYSFERSHWYQLFLFMTTVSPKSPPATSGKTLCFMAPRMPPLSFRGHQGLQDMEGVELRRSQLGALGPRVGKLWPQGQIPRMIFTFLNGWEEGKRKTTSKENIFLDPWKLFTGTEI